MRCMGLVQSQVFSIGGRVEDLEDRPEPEDADNMPTVDDGDIRWQLFPDGFEIEANMSMMATEEEFDLAIERTLRTARRFNAWLSSVCQ